jgi:hypothetical protein
MLPPSVFALHNENSTIIMRQMFLVKIIAGNAKAYVPDLTSVAHLAKGRGAHISRVAPQHF